MRKFPYLAAVWAAFAGITLWIGLHNAKAQGNERVSACANPVGRIVSYQGKVELRRGPAGSWVPVTQLDQTLCAGDLLHAGARSRAAVVLVPETIVRLDQHSTISLRTEGSEVHVEMFLDRDLRPDQIGNACGVGYFITRFPKKFRVYTPYLNAAVEGTEFQVALACDRAELSVFEGRVAAESAIAQGARTLVASSQLVSAGPEGAVSPIALLVRPADSVQWALYYPRTERVMQDGIAEDCETLAGAQKSACHLRLADTLLSAGRVDEALARIDSGAESVPESAELHALKSVIQVTKNQKDEALTSARRAVAMSDQSSRAWLALSYAQQAHFQLEEALRAAVRAGNVAPSSALIQARVAELLFALGDRPKAAEAARRAVATNPDESRAHSISGFVELAQVDITQAKNAFQRAIALDSTDPMPRLGMGLALIRSGELEAGREQIEIAVALDPTRSLLRSYLGKAYYEENTDARDALASGQYALAKTMDPEDPTAHLFDAVLLHSRNDPVHALSELKTSIEKNDNRAIYRSRLALDQDLAGKSVELGNLYRTLGFEDMALPEAAKSLALDPRNGAAHSLLADAYANRPRHEIARVSARLQGQLLQPAHASTLRPENAFASLNPQLNVNWTTASLNEYTSLTQHNGVNARVSSLGGNLHVRGGEAALSGLKDNLAFGVGLFRYGTDGFRANNDFSSATVELFGQADAAPWLSLQAALQKRDANFGHLDMNFDPRTFETARRQFSDEEVMRLGARITPGAGDSTLLLSYRGNHIDGGLLQFPGAPVVQANSILSSDGDAFDIQYLGSFSGWNLMLGSNLTRIRQTQTTALDIELFPGFVITSTFDSPGLIQEQAHYAMLSRSISGHTFSTGATYDIYREGKRDTKEINPRIGWIWSPNDALRLRAAYFETLTRALVMNQTVEPTQVAGFNLFFDDFNATQARVVGFGGDSRLGRNVLLSADFYRRRLDIAGTFAATGDPGFEPARDDNLAMAVHWTSSQSSVLSLGLDSNRFRYAPIDSQSNAPVDFRTRIVSAKLKHFLSGTGFFGALEVQRLEQDVTRLPSATSASGDESVTLVDVGVGWRLPRRRGSVALEVRNLFDQGFFYQDNNFRTAGVYLPPFVPARTFLLKGSLSF